MQNDEASKFTHCKKHAFSRDFYHYVDTHPLPAKETNQQNNAHGNDTWNQR